ncbi:MAG: endonuclease MutS2 [Lachnospiraceae bacterium]|nr:endonuclease MutS2 [Lachnospiraceae bacterium]
MNERALRILEYDKIVAALAEHADSAPGRTLCLALLPSADRSEILARLCNTRDAIERYLKKSEVSFGSCFDGKEVLQALRLGRSLEAGTLLRTALFLYHVGRIRSYGQSEEERQDTLSPYFEALVPMKELSEEIRRCILSESEIADDASPGLKQARRSITRIGEQIRRELSQMATGSLRQYLQDGVITMRGDRYCLPVRAEYKAQVNGIVHDASASGQTLFIEPQSIVNLNNSLREARLAEQEEIEKVLEDLSSRLAVRSDDLAFDLETAAFLDFTFAKAKLALETGAMVPHFNERQAFILRRARHPLIPEKKAVPIDVYLGDAFDLLIITGPNTGGKTVTLKTVGLLTLMGQAGLAIPAGDRSELAVFDEVFADIGDEQSIEQSLSTFSSHMKNVVEILQKADERSLCLFDELGAGTDPTEGAALAVAVMDSLHRRKIRTMATTHYSECKVYAMTTNGVMNAACEFDVETLRPTYKLLIGVPGSSNAFAISKKLGLPDEVIDAARKRVDEDAESFDRLLADLQTSRRKADVEREQLEALKAEAASLEATLKKQRDRIDREREKLLKEAHEEAREVLKEAKQVADETIRMMNRTGVSVRELEQARAKVGSEITRKEEKLASAQKDKKQSWPPVKPDKLKKGDLVRVISMGLTGTVSSLPDKKGELFVTCGIMKSKVHVSDLTYAREESDGKKAIRELYGAKREKRDVDLSRSMHISTECHLIGMTVDEALAALDRYLDDAYMAHVKSARIVHGKGTGALRRAVQEHLESVPYVKSYKAGEFGEGDTGVTIVTFS